MCCLLQEVLEEARVQADLEEWILKLEEIKRDIDNRERLYSEFVRDKKSWLHAQQKVDAHCQVTFNLAGHSVNTILHRQNRRKKWMTRQ